MKIIRHLLLLFFVLKFGFIYSQNVIDVGESTLKIGGLKTEEFYYGFEEGDQIIFNFEELNGKELNEIEILEYPSASKFMDYKTAKIENKKLTIIKTGIYKFRFANSAMSARICKYKIQRIPVSEAGVKFNTSVYWKTIRDTSFYMVDEKYLVSIDTIVIPVISNKVERVHSQTSTNGLPNKSNINFVLPENTVSWSYYIGVGDSSEEIFKKAEEKAKKTTEQITLASNSLATIDPTGSMALAALALKGFAEFGVPSQADNIQYWFVTDNVNAQLFMNGSQFLTYENGNGPLSVKRMTSPIKGGIFLCLLNDNIRTGIDVYIRISAVTVKQNWGIKKVQHYKVNTWEEPYLKN